jgi:hypothetical protein
VQGEKMYTIKEFNKETNEFIGSTFFMSKLEALEFMVRCLKLGDLNIEYDIQKIEHDEDGVISEFKPKI